MSTRAQNLLQQADQFLVGSCLGSFRLPDEVATVFQRGEGSRIWDVDGNEFIDYVLGSGPMILGHSHPSVVAAVRKQVGLGSTYYGLNEPAIELARRIVEAVPCGEQLRFVCSGTEGTLMALRLARAFTGREKIVKFEGGWHGGHDYAQQSSSPGSGPAAYPTPITESAGIPRAATDTVLVAPFNDPDTTTFVVKEAGSDLAAIIVEPLQRSLCPQAGFLDHLKELCDDTGALLIFDEVVTGFRIAWGGAQERYGITPDLAVYGKTISGGYPLAAICGRTDVMSCADPRRKEQDTFVFISGTTNGNPVATTAGLATLDKLEEDGFYSGLFTVCEQLQKGLEQVGRDAGCDMQVIGEGPVLQPFFTSEQIVTHADTLKANSDLARRFGIELVRRGIFTTPGGKIYISAAHTAEDIDHTLTVAADALAAVLT